MPCIIKVRILAGRNLPVMDRASESTDAYVELKFADFEVQRTPICRKTLNPVWNQDFRFECPDDAEAQNEPLEIRVMDYDAISYNDLIGLVFLDLNPLLTASATGAAQQISGWFPIADTIRGVRGEINIHVKVQFFDDINPFKESSTGVQFFAMACVPPGHTVQALLGFAEVLLSEDDPEYHWTDNFRTPRTSNEARMRCMHRLSGQVRRQLGKRALELGANAIVGLRQYFDLEAEERIITARAIGTAVRLQRVSVDGEGEAEAGAPANPASSASALAPGAAEVPAALAPISNETNVLAGQVQLVTLTSLPAFAIRHLGGLVMAASVKVVETDEENEREAWWQELRDEVRGHARSLGCGFIVGYTEQFAMLDDVCVLMCQGCACAVDARVLYQPRAALADVRSGSRLALGDGPTPAGGDSTPGSASDAQADGGAVRGDSRAPCACELAHIPYKRENAPFPMAFVRCGACRRRLVPEFLLVPAEVPPEAEVLDHGTLVEAHVCRPYKNKDSESAATLLSEALPFVLYELHRQLVYKLRIYALNAVFALRFQIRLGDAFLVALASGTAVFLRALPVPAPIAIQCELDAVSARNAAFQQLQRQIERFSRHNHRRMRRVATLKSRAEARSSAPGDESDSSVEFPAVETPAMSTSPPSSGASSPPSSRASSPPSSPASSFSLENGRSRSLTKEPRDDTGDAAAEDLERAGRRGRAPGRPSRRLEPRATTNNQRRAPQPMVLQIDDTADEELLGVLLDPALGSGLRLLSTSTGVAAEKRISLVPSLETRGDTQMLVAYKRAQLDPALPMLNQRLGLLFRDLYEDLEVQLAPFARCVVANVAHHVALLDDDEVHVQLTATAVGTLAGPVAAPSPSFWAHLGVLEAADDPASVLQSLAAGRDVASSGEQRRGRSSLRRSIRAAAGDLKAALPRLPPLSMASMAIPHRTSVPGSMPQKPAPPRPYPTTLAAVLASMAGARTPDGPPGRPRVLAPDTRDELAHTDLDVDDMQAATLLAIPERLLDSDLAVPSPSAGAAPPASSGVFVSSPVVYYRNSAPSVELSTLGHVPGTRIARYIGRVALHFVREGSLSASEPIVVSGSTPSAAAASRRKRRAKLDLAQAAVDRLAATGANAWSARPSGPAEAPEAGADRHAVPGACTGGLGPFCHSVLAEVCALVRAHVGALGGNALLAFSVDQCVMEESFKNQGYALVSISGDAVQLVRDAPSAELTARAVGMYNVELSTAGVLANRDRPDAADAGAHSLSANASPLTAQAQLMEYLPPPVLPRAPAGASVVGAGVAASGVAASGGAPGADGDGAALSFFHAASARLSPFAHTRQILRRAGGGPNAQPEPAGAVRETAEPPKASTLLALGAVLGRRTRSGGGASAAPLGPAAPTPMEHSEHPHGHHHGYHHQSSDPASAAVPGPVSGPVAPTPAPARRLAALRHHALSASPPPGGSSTASDGASSGRRSRPHSLAGAPGPTVSNGQHA